MRFFFFIFITIIVFGCVRSKEIPEGILSQNEMRKLMWDLMRADAFVTDFIEKDSTRDKKQESAILYEEIFSLHSTTQEAFKKSVAFYESRPDLFKPIADSLKSDEKKAMEYPEKKVQLDTTLEKMRLRKSRIKK